jgi:Protein of unknown function (DUF3662)/FHA domain
MRPLVAVEQFFERLFERPSARLFRSPLQPVQVQRRLERALDEGKVFAGDLAYAPSRFTVTLHPNDATAFDGDHDVLTVDLAEALRARARSRGYLLLARPTVALRVSRDASEGDIEVQAEPVDRDRLARLHAGARVDGASLERAGRLVAVAIPVRDADNGRVPAVRSIPPQSIRALAGPSRPEAPPTGAFVRVASPPESGVGDSTLQPIATIEVRTQGHLVSDVPFTGGRMLIGRGLENDICLVDDRVSRQHGALSVRMGVMVYTDVGSTNGSFLNGARIREIVLGSGDVVRLGNSTLTIRSRS